MNYTQAKCQLFKGTLFTAGLGIGVGALYSLTHVYQKGKELYQQNEQTNILEQKIKTDSRFQNGYILTKFCIDVYTKSNEANK